MRMPCESATLTGRDFKAGREFKRRCVPRPFYRNPEKALLTDSERVTAYSSPTGDGATSGASAGWANGFQREESATIRPRLICVEYIAVKHSFSVPCSRHAFSVLRG